MKIQAVAGQAPERQPEYAISENQPQTISLYGVELGGLGDGLLRFRLYAVRFFCGGY